MRLLNMLTLQVNLNHYENIIIDITYIKSRKILYLVDKTTCLRQKNSLIIR